MYKIFALGDREVRRLTLFVVFFIGVFASTAGATSAAGNTGNRQPKPVDWNQRDTAIYVVSTLNLLRTRAGASVADRLVHRLGIAHFDVYADTQENNLYFIELRRVNGDIAGAFAYLMGWQKPLSVTPFCNRLSPRAPAAIVSDYRSDSRQFLGSFPTTLPA